MSREIQPRHRIEAAVFATLLWVARWLPRRFLMWLGSLGGRLAYLVDWQHRGIALENLNLAYGDDLDPRQARRIVAEAWRFFGRVLMDTLTFSRMTPERPRRRVRYEGLEHLEAAYAKGRGVLFFTGHFGHWELSAMLAGVQGRTVSVVARPLDNPLLERILERLRGATGNRVLHKRNAVRAMMQELKKNRGVGVLIDQDMRDAGVFVPFFGRPASTTPAVALLALRTGAVILPAYVLDLPEGGWLARYGAPVEVEVTSDLDVDVHDLTARCTAILEGWIRERPNRWLWMHRRWKSLPPPQPPAGGSTSTARERASTIDS